MAPNNKAALRVISGSAGQMQRDTAYAVWLTAGWAVLALIIRPTGEFPLNDDWVYAQSARLLAQSGHWHLSDFSQAFGIPQIGLGALLSDLFGFSFSTLRLLGLTFGWVGMLATQALMRQIGCTSAVAVMIAAAVACNPLYFAMSATFMTDMPFYAFTITSLAMLARGFRKNNEHWLLAGLMMTIPAILTRQLGLVLPLGFAVAYVSSRPKNAQVLLVAVAPLLLATAMYLLVNAWLGSAPKNLSSFSAQSEQFIGSINRFLNGSVGGLKNLLLLVQYLGFFTLPTSWPWLHQYLANASFQERRTLIRRLLSWAVLMAVPLIAKGLLMPSALNVLTPYGIGPMTLKDTFILKQNQIVIPDWLHIVWWLVTFLSVFGAALIVERVWSIARAAWLARHRMSRDQLDPMSVLLFVATASYAFLVTMVTAYLDRYLLLCLPVAYALFVSVPRTSMFQYKQSSTRKPGNALAPLVFSCMLVMMMALFSTTALRDYLEWNRQRWHALNELTEVRQIPRTKIDGGYEFNGWYLYQPGGARFGDKPRSWWWVTDDEYVVASGPIDGYREVMSYPFRRWLIGGQISRVVVLKRVDALALQRP